MIVLKERFKNTWMLKGNSKIFLHDKMDQIYLDKFHSRYNGWFTEVKTEVTEEIVEEKPKKTKSKTDDSDYKGTD